MTQITLRVPDDLLEDVEESLGEEESRSEFFRRAARVEASRRGVRPEPNRSTSRFDDLRDDLEDLEARVDRLEEQQRESLIDRILG